MKSTSTKAFDLEALIVEVGQSEEITAIAAFKDHTEALYVPANPFANTNRVLINEMALAARLPTVHGFRPYVESGGLMSYGPIRRICFGAPAITSTGYCEVQAGRPSDRATDQI